MAAENELIRVGVVGASGRMGREVLKALTPSEGFEILLAIDRENVGRSCRELIGAPAPEVVIENKLGAALDRVKVDVVVDFSHHSSAATHAASCMKRGVSPIIGCTGLSDPDMREIQLDSKETGVPAMYVPNFAIGAVLMMHFAHLAAKWLPNVEILEMHHDKKEDAPSGTALLTADLIAQGRQRLPDRQVTSITKVEGARGGKFCEVPIHSVRLPGLVAHQQVMFGGQGEVLTVRHDSLDRASFMDGVKMCVRSVRTLKGLTVGLDKILFGKH